jgi:hypothetical protein
VEITLSVRLAHLAHTARAPRDVAASILPRKSKNSAISAFRASFPHLAQSNFFAAGAQRG